MKNRQRGWRKLQKQNVQSNDRQPEEAKKEAAGTGQDGKRNLSSEPVDQHRPFPADLRRSEEMFKAIFRDCSDVVFRTLRLGHTDGMMIFLDGIVNTAEIQENALRPLLFNFVEQGKPVTPEAIEMSGISISQVAQIDTVKRGVEAILAGSVLLLLDGQTHALGLSAKGGTRRSVEEPGTEASIRGPREGFTESLRTNTALLRNKIKSDKLKTVPYTIGEVTQTNVVLCYLDGICDQSVLDEAKKRLEAIKIDGVLESGYIEELIEDEPYSPFPQMQYTERPDTVAGQLLEGRFAIFVDGTPFVLIAPATFWQMMQASEDYYERYLISNLIRWLRYTFAFIALYLPSLYIAVTTFHQDMLPTNLLLSVATARESIPFPALVEALLMEIAFEALREAGIRLPKTIGQAVSILGALVIGQAAVQAGIVSAPMVIIVSLTGIASFTIPRYNMAISFRMLRFGLMFMAGAFGLFGIVIGTMWIGIHLCHLRSFGVPYMSGTAPFNKGALRDIFFRQPWWGMVRRPGSIGHRDRKRMKAGLKPEPPKT